MCNRYRLIYSTVNPNVEPIDNINRHEMSYSLPEIDYPDKSKFVGEKIIAVITDKNGIKTTHTPRAMDMKTLFNLTVCLWRQILEE